MRHILFYRVADPQYRAVQQGYLSQFSGMSDRIPADRRRWICPRRSVLVTRSERFSEELYRRIMNRFLQTAFEEMMANASSQRTWGQTSFTFAKRHLHVG
jgi:hypothetical protein